MIAPYAWVQFRTIESDTCLQTLVFFLEKNIEMGTKARSLAISDYDLDAMIHLSNILGITYFLKNSKSR